MTITELMKLVDKVTEEVLPSAKSLWNSEVDIVLEHNVEKDTIIRVYKNGYVVFRAGNHVTVFPLQDISDVYGYEDMCGTCSENHISCKDMECAIRLLLEGLDRIERNGETCYGRKKISYSAESEEWEVLADKKDYAGDVLDRLFIEELMSILTDRQKEYIRKYYFEEKQMPEIACELGITKQAVSDGIRLALNKMRKAARK